MGFNPFGFPLFFPGGGGDRDRPQPLLGGTEDGDLGGGGGSFFPLFHRGTVLIELLSAALSIPAPIAYGRHVVGGNVIFQQETANGDVVLFVALGDGEWDGPDVIYVNDRQIDLTDTALVHFHPGTDGEAGVESDPATRNQKICSFYPVGFRPQLSFSRTAYISFTLPRDPANPEDTGEFEVRGVYRTRRVRLFDNLGNQTGYAYSTNPAWCALDLLISRFLKPHGTANEALTAAEKNLVDFQAFKDWADFCDETLTVNGETVKRFETHLAFVDQVDLLRALDAILLSGRAYLLERQGKLTPVPDQARTPVLALDADDFAPGSFELSRRPLRDNPNLFRFTYRDLDSGRGLGSISSTGIVVTGTDTSFINFFEQNDAIELRTGPQKGQVRQVRFVNSDTELLLFSAFSADQPSGTGYANAGRDFELRVRQVADEDHQDQIGRIQTLEMDLGNSTPERVERLSEYLRRSLINRRRRVSCRLLSGLAGAINLLPGDLITAPDDLEYLTSRSWEIEEITDEPDGSRRIVALEYDPDIFVDTAGPQPQLPDPLDLGGAFVSNAVQVANLLKNSNFFKTGVAGQEGADNALHFKRYSNAGGAPASPTDIEWKADRDVYILKTSTSAVDKIGIRSLWNNLGLLFKPGQPVTVAVALRHSGSGGLYDKAVKFKLDSSAEDYPGGGAAKLEFTIPANRISNKFQVFPRTLVLKGAEAVPNTLNLFLWSEATNASKSNFDLEVDWVTLVGGRVWVHYDPGGVPYTAAWQAGPGLYDIQGDFVKDAAPGSDVGGAGEAAGGVGTQDQGVIL